MNGESEGVRLVDLSVWYVSFELMVLHSWFAVGKLTAGDERVRVLFKKISK